MFQIFGILAVVASLFLVLLIVIQNSKGGGLNNAFGASNISNMIGARRANADVERFTWYTAAAIGVLAILTMAFTPAPKSGSQSRVSKGAENLPAITNQMQTAPGGAPGTVPTGAPAQAPATPQ